LAVALDSLNTALADQRSAIATWRDVLGELKATTEGLDDSLRRYRTNLRTLGHSVSTLRAKAKALEQWADGLVLPAD
jgi:ABC-type transporter Mla subunit MlaD